MPRSLLSCGGFSPVLCWQYLVALVAVWGLLNIVPWDVVYGWDWYRDFVRLMEKAIASISLMPEQAQHRGMAYSRAQLSAIHFLGFANVVLCFAFTREAMFLPGTKSSRMLVGGLACATVGMTGLVFLIAWPAEFRGSLSDLYHDTEARMTAFYVVYWYGTAGFISMAKACFLRLLRDTSVARGN